MARQVFKTKAESFVVQVAKSTLISLGAGLAVIATSSFSINCGTPALPPTEIGVERRIPYPTINTNPLPQPISANLSALINIIAGHSIVIARSDSTSICVEFGALKGVVPSESGPYDCSARGKLLGDSPATELSAGTCYVNERAQVSDSTDPGFSIFFTPTNEKDVGLDADLATDTDFTKFVGKDVDGYVVTDTADPASKATLHDSASYCQDSFTLVP